MPNVVEIEVVEAGRKVRIQYLADIKRERLIAAGLVSPDGLTPQRWSTSKPTLRLLGTEDYTAEEPPGFGLWCYDRLGWEDPWDGEASCIG